tara:strand:+ start:233 stop:412 length:180 start_codon:yes stop_codon:yes gene_type:complete
MKNIEKVKGSLGIAHNSLKIYGDENISDSLLKHNLMHLLSACNDITNELNRREVMDQKI